MNPSSPPDQSATFNEPRLLSDFRPVFYPRVNNQEPPGIDAAERNDQVALEFAAAYYDLNTGYARLLEARAHPDLPERGELEKKCLQNIEELLIVRDRLEDQRAPFGVVAEPVVKEGFTVNINISYGNVDAAGKLRTEMYTITACVPVPLPEGIQVEALPITIEGPGIIPG
jgi:hypothetical protein